MPHFAKQIADLEESMALRDQARLKAAYEQGRRDERAACLADIESMSIHCSAGFECAAVIRCRGE